MGGWGGGARVIVEIYFTNNQNLKKKGVGGWGGTRVIEFYFTKNQNLEKEIFLGVGGGAGGDEGGWSK